MTITQYRKEIVYDRETRDYAMRLDGELVGFARTHHEAEVTLNQIVYELLHAQPIVTKDEEEDEALMAWLPSPQLPVVDTCPSCGDPLPAGARLCAACVESDEPSPIVNEIPQYSISDRCPTCGGEGDCPDCDTRATINVLSTRTVDRNTDLTTQMYQLLCLMLSGTAGAATVLTLARELVARYESEVKK
jgi:hypothetical protein